MKERVFTKFCGITTKESIKDAQNAGCDALGFVFVKKSKRYISVERYKQLERSISPLMMKVALFADNDKNEVKEVLKTCDFNVIQFHGNESRDFCSQWGRPYWKAIPMLDTISLQDWMDEYHDANGFVLDHFGKNHMAGSGTQFNWSEIPENTPYNWILAGGLNPSNISLARQETGMKHFDVSSGIESQPGIKSKILMENFIENLKN